VNLWMAGGRAANQSAGTGRRQEQRGAGRAKPHGGVGRGSGRGRRAGEGATRRVHPGQPRRIPRAPRRVHWQASDFSSGMRQGTVDAVKVQGIRVVDSWRCVRRFFRSAVR